MESLVDAFKKISNEASATADVDVKMEDDAAPTANSDVSMSVTDDGRIATSIPITSMVELKEDDKAEFGIISINRNLTVM